MAVPKDSYLLMTIAVVVFLFYFLSFRTFNEAPMGFEMVDMHQHRDANRETPLDGMEMLRNPKNAPKVDHNIKGPIYNFNIPGLTEGWVTLSDSTRVYKINVSPLKSFEGKRPHVLLLHASQYSPYAWVETGLLFKLRDSGFKSVAIDMPGHHVAKNLPKLTEENEYFTFLNDVIAAENMRDCVVIAPEMSAEFVLPLIRRREEILKSVILVSPPHQFDFAPVLNSSVKTMLMTGEFENFELKRYTSPNLQHVVIPLSANFFFVENSVQFNQIIMKYLMQLVEPETNVPEEKQIDL